MALYNYHIKHPSTNIPIIFC